MLVIEKYEDDTDDINVTGQVFYQNNSWQVKFQDCEDYASGVCPYRISSRLKRHSAASDWAYISE